MQTRKMMIAVLIACLMHVDAGSGTCKGLGDLCSADKNCCPTDNSKCSKWRCNVDGCIAKNKAGCRRDDDCCRSRGMINQCTAGKCNLNKPCVEVGLKCERDQECCNFNKNNLVQCIMGACNWNKCGTNGNMWCSGSMDCCHNSTLYNACSDSICEHAVYRPT